MKRKLFFWLILITGIGLRLYYVMVSPYIKSGVPTCDICTFGLMAKHILQGEFPLFFYGQYYLGPLEPLVIAFFFKIFGIKIQIIYLGALFFSALFIISTYFLGKILQGESLGLWAMLYAVLPPSFFFGESVTPVGYHIEIPVLGNLLFIAALCICREKGILKKRIYYIILGLFAGIGFWVHYIILYYILSVGIYLLLKEKILVILKNGLLTIFSAMMVSLPFWVFTFQNDFCTFRFKSNPSVELVRYSANLGAFLSSIMSMMGLGFIGIQIIYFIMISYFIFNKKTLKTDGMLFVLFFFIVMGVYVFYRSHMYAVSAAYYLLPVISFIPIVFAFFCNRLFRWNKSVGVIFAISIISVNTFNIVGLIKKDILNSRQNEIMNSSKIKFLEENNIYRIAGDDRRLREIEFFSNEKIIGTGFESGDYFPHEDIVDASSRVAFETCDTDWKPTLNNICESYRFENNLYFGFKPFPYLIKSILPYDWHAVSNRNTFSVKWAFDRNCDFFWHTGIAKHTGDYFSIDLGMPYKICCIRIFNAHHYLNYPKSYKVEVSIDQKNWKEACYMENPITLFWSGPRIYWRSIFGREECFFKPVSARYVRLIQIGDDKKNSWEINEIFVYEYLGERPFYLRDYIKELKGIMAFLDNKKISFVYADYWLSAEIRRASRDKIRALVSYNSWRPFRKDMDRRVYLYRDRAIIVANEDAEELENIMKEFNINYGKKIFDRHICYYFPNFEEKNPISYFMWMGTGLAKHSLKDYSKWLYKQGEYEKALRYYPNNFMAYLKCKILPRTRFLPETEKAISFVNGIKFLGYSIRGGKFRPGGIIRIEYFWESQDDTKSDLSVFVYFMKDGKIIFQNDHKFLYQFPRPLNPLEEERFREVLKLKLPNDLSSGNYQIIIGLWDKNTGKRVKIKDPSGKKISKQIIGELVIP